MALTKCDVPGNVIGSLATRAEERGLTPQEFKDKFDEMPEGIKQYINEVLTEEIDAHIADYLVHKAESAGKHITESDGYGNGYYIRFDDGTQICTLDGAEINRISTTRYGQNISLPKTFLNKDSYTVTCTVQSLGSFEPYGLYVGKNDSISIAVNIYGSNFPDGKAVVDIIAVGRWK